MQGSVCTPLPLASSRLSDSRRVHFSDVGLGPEHDWGQAMLPMHSV